MISSLKTIYELFPYHCLFMIWSLMTVYLWFDPLWLLIYDLIPYDCLFMIWSLMTVYLWFDSLWRLIYDLIPYDNFVIWHTTVLVLWWFIYYLILIYDLIPYNCLFMIWSLMTPYLWFDPLWLFIYDLIPLLYSLTLPVMMMMKVKRGRMEGWFPLGKASTSLKIWWRTCTLTRRMASYGCGGSIRNVKEASWGTTWGRWTKSI